MADTTTGAIAVAGSALTIAAVQAGLPMAIGFAATGAFGAAVGHARWTLDRERKDPGGPTIPYRIHGCMMLRAVLMAEFVAMILLLAWVEYRWPWTWGLIVCAVSSVFASEAIELMWVAVQKRFRSLMGIEEVKP